MPSNDTSEDDLDHLLLAAKSSGCPTGWKLKLSQHADRSGRNQANGNEPEHKSGLVKPLAEAPQMTLVILQNCQRNRYPQHSSGLVSISAYARSTVQGSKTCMDCWLRDHCVRLAARHPAARCDDFFRDDVTPPRVSLALDLHCCSVYLALLSRIPHSSISYLWIGIQVFRILGGILSHRWCRVNCLACLPSRPGMGTC